MTTINAKIAKHAKINQALKEEQLFAALAALASIVVVIYV